jgi:endoglucanase
MNRAVRAGRSLVLGAVFLLAAFSGFAKGNTEGALRGGFIRTDGQRLVTQDGAPFEIKGINLGHWFVPEGYMFGFNRDAEAAGTIVRVFERLLGPERAADFWVRFHNNYITEPDIRFIASVGFNTIRVPVDYRMFVDGGIQRFRGVDGFALLDRLVGWANAAGVRVIIDLHAAQGGQVGAAHDGGVGFPLLYYVRSYQDATVDLWRKLAQRYRDEPAVLGYDILNEPIAPHHDTKYLEPRLEPLLKRITVAINGVAPRQLIFLNGSRWGTSFVALGKPFADNLVYSYHSYWSSPRRSTIQPQLNYRLRYNVPILIAETGEATDDWIERFRKMHDDFGIGWIFWTYKNLNQTTTVASIPLPKDWPAIVDAAERLAIDPDAPIPDEAVITRAFDDYLQGLDLKNCTIRWSYLAALGLKSAPIPDEKKVPPGEPVKPPPDGLVVSQGSSPPADGRSPALAP